MEKESKSATVEELCDAVRSGNVELVDELLRRGADVNEPEYDIVGWRAAHEAAIKGKAQVLQLLITAGADVNAAGRNGCTPAHSAARQGNTEVLKILVTAGADLNLTSSNGVTPAHVAAADGKTEALRILIEAGADFNLREMRLGATPLTKAVIHKRIDTCRLLLSHGACFHGIGLEQESGDTALITTASASVGKGDHCKTLIEAGEDVNHQNKHGDTALLTAARVSTGDTCKTLLAAGADVNHQNKHGDTALIVAARRGGSNRICLMLLAANANSNLCNKQGKTAADVAKKKMAKYITYWEDRQGKEVNREQSAATSTPLPINPGGLDEIMKQSPATWEVDSEKEELPGMTSIERDTKNNPSLGFAVPSPLPSNSVQGSSLFESDPPLIHHLPTTNPQTDRYGLHGESLVIDQEDRMKFSDTEEIIVDKMQLSVKPLKAVDEIIEENNYKLASKEETLKENKETMEETIGNKPRKLASNGNKIIPHVGKIEETPQYQISTERKLKEKGKPSYECEEMLEEQEKAINEKDKPLALKEDRVTQMEKYQEEVRKKRKHDEDDDGTVAKEQCMH